MDIIIDNNTKFIEIDNVIYRVKSLSIHKNGGRRCPPRFIFKSYPQGLDRKSVISTWLFKPICIVKELPSNEEKIKYGVVISIIDNDDNGYIIYGMEIRLFNAELEAIEFSKQYEAIQ